MNMYHSNVDSLSVTDQSPLEVYQSQLGGKLVEDPSQLAAINALDVLFGHLTRSKTLSCSTIKGLYLWGDVGRGKTYLMDMFYDCLPDKGKLRLHFHRFMARIHQSLNDYSGEQNPIELIAHDLSKTCRVLCFDEFFVSDIADAMILAGLFECLFKQDVVLVTTSNTPIERLYENGLARHKFLPCISLLQQHTEMLHLNGKLDHRLHFINEEINTHVNRVSPSSSPSSSPASSFNIGIKGEIDFDAIFRELTHTIFHQTIKTSSLTICHRDIPVKRATPNGVINSVAWFDFSALCDSHRSQLDYIEIANRFNTVMLSDVPYLGGEIRGWIKARGTEDGIGDNQAMITGERVVNYASTDNSVRRFISLIDELYDQNVILFLSSDVPLSGLYKEGALTFEFRRTYSRLMEMSQRTVTL
ncbi:MAG: cell division protein ZapE [Paraglaciecola sp.]|jgi:cell division protein ZapE